MTKEPRTFIRYSISFKQKVVKEIEDEGLGKMEAGRRYGIKGDLQEMPWKMKQFSILDNNGNIIHFGGEMNS